MNKELKLNTASRFPVTGRALTAFRALAAGLFLLAGQLFAPSILRAGSTDTLALFVTPIVTYGVTISSVNEKGYDFGSVDLGSVSRSTHAIVVQNTGNIGSQWQLRSQGSANWAPAAIEGYDQYVLMGVFTSTATTTPVSDSEFTDGQDEILADYKNATGTVNSSRYNAGTDLNMIRPMGQADSKRHLWLKLKMPSGSSTAEEQRFRLYITAVQIGQE